MKTRINTLQDALTYHLQGLAYAEKKIHEQLSSFLKLVTSENVKDEMRSYMDSSNSKLLKLERVFNYLMEEPYSREDEVVTKILYETNAMIFNANSLHLRDILMIGCIQTINAYKTAGYRTAYLFAVELEMDTAADLLQQILEWESETSNALAALSINEFNTGAVTFY